MHPLDMASPTPDESKSGSKAVEKNAEYYFTDLFILVSVLVPCGNVIH
jgi:hypothetical protein